MKRYRKGNPVKPEKSWLVYLSLFAVLSLVLFGCAITSRSGIPRNAVQVEVAASASLQPWLEEAVAAFNDQRVETAQGKPAYVTLSPVEAGQAVADISSGAARPDLWIPDDPVWSEVLANEGDSSFTGDCASIAQSPLVIAMWRPIAESLGWPGRKIGWLDVGSLAADPSAWEYYSGGQFGSALRLGHTHPGLSGSGALTMLAIVQAAQSKAEAVSVADIQEPIVKASVGAFEGAVSWFSKSTDALAQALRERGSSFLGAAVMYESTVVQYGDGNPQLVPIYPFEGTYVATFPACLNSASAEAEQEGALAFRQFLLGEEGQKLALEHGFRPVNPQVPAAAPLEPGRGVDLSQPEVVFDPPSADTVLAVQELWQSARKKVNLVMVLDASGSMQGSKIENVKAAAVQFVRQMGDEDYLSLVLIDKVATVIFEHQQVGPQREEIISVLEGLEAGGGTPLYDAIAEAAGLIAGNSSPETTNAMVVLSDGQDTASERYSFDQGLVDLAAANDTTVFTIAYGYDADEDVLSQFAEQANGNFYQGDEASIDLIYDEMSAAFGGAAGVGR